MKYKLICFDLDGTLIDGIEYAWETLHTAFGIPKEHNRANIKAYNDGKLSYADWCRIDVALWKEKGITKKDIIREVKKLKLMNGAKETLDELKKRGCKLALISGSFSTVIEILFPDHPFDDVFINELEFNKDGLVTGIRPTPFDMEHKAAGLKMIAEREGIPLSECVFIGDHINDVHIAKIAGFSIAFNSKSEELNKVCDVVVKKKDLREILKYIE